MLSVSLDRRGLLEKEQIPAKALRNEIRAAAASVRWTSGTERRRGGRRATGSEIMIGHALLQIVLVECLLLALDHRLDVLAVVQ